MNEELGDIVTCDANTFVSSDSNETPVLYQVLPEKRGDRIGASMMGSTHVYDMSTAKVPNAAAAAANMATNRGGAAGGGPSSATTAEREGMVELALDPSELDMDNEAMAQRYEQQMREQQSHLQKEDLSDMLAEHVARQKSKRKRQQGGAAGATGGTAAGGEGSASKQQKKYKEFKF